jgi:hypothetical protein
MSTQPQPTPQAARPKPAVIRTAPGQANVTDSWTRLIPAWIISLVAHAVILGLFAVASFLTFARANAPAADITTVQETKVEDDTDTKDLTNPDIGIDPSVPLNYNVDRIEDVSVPGPVDPSQAVGIPGAPPDAPMENIPAPPGFGTNGLGKGIDSDTPGTAGIFGTAGGSGGLMMAGGFGGRSGSTREKLALQGGGNALSEAAVAAGLLFLARHQAPDGHWSLDQFNLNVNVKFPESGNRLGNDQSTGQGTKNDIAGTAFGLLPFLGAGETHKPPSPGAKKSVNYQKVVETGLRYLMSKQTRDGEFPGGMYAHGLAAITMCEAYGLTSDPLLKTSAQKAIDFIVKAQDPGLGGWRYTPRAGSDTSVTGWEVMALKSGQMAGLSVPKSTLDGASKWLDSCMTNDKGGYGYTGPQETPTMSAVGLLCRMYLGWSPKNPGLQAGVTRLKANPPTALNNMYYYYYATQVMHHMGGESFEFWNPKMRDLLIKGQDMGKDSKHPWQKGSWDPSGDVHGKVGGRIMITSLSLLTLEVYYRHLPLYRRDMGVMKEAAQ